MKKIFLISASIFALSTPALAQDHHHEHFHDHHEHEYSDGKKWSVHLDAMTYFTSIYDAEEADEEVVDIFSHSHLTGRYQFTRNISLNGTLLLEGDPAGHAHGGGATRTGDRVFDDHPLFIEQLTLNYDNNYYGAFIGKFNPILGVDKHDVPGWFGALVFEEFEISERLGFGGHVEAMEQRLDVSTYFADTTFLQESVLYDRDTIDDDDGGIANTEDFSSFSAQLSGNIIDPLSYYIGYAHQGNDNNGEDDESRLILGVQGHMDVTEDFTIKAMADITDIDHLNGEEDHDRAYLSLGLGADFQKWNAGMTYTKLDNKSSDMTEGLDGYIAQASIGYDIGYGFGVDVGYHVQKEEGETSKRFGSLLRYHIDF